MDRNRDSGPALRGGARRGEIFDTFGNIHIAVCLKYSRDGHAYFRTRARAKIWACIALPSCRECEGGGSSASFNGAIRAVLDPTRIMDQKKYRRHLLTLPDTALAPNYREFNGRTVVPRAAAAQDFTGPVRLSCRCPLRSVAATYRLRPRTNERRAATGAPSQKCRRESA